MKKFDLKNLQGSKRTLRSGSYATVLAVVVLAFVILVNLVVHALPSKWTEFDISTSSLFTLSDTSKNLLHELNSDVTAYYLVESGQEDTNITNLGNVVEGWGVSEDFWEPWMDALEAYVAAK